VRTKQILALHHPARLVFALASAAMIAALSFTVLPTGTADASITGRTAVTTAAATGPTAGTEDPLSTVVGSTSLQTSGTDAGGNLDGVEASGVSCATLTTHNWIKDIFDITLANYYMYTYWCWNGTKVTTHTTWESGSVTATGSATGWEYDGVVESSFNCYYANSVKCSGNHETSEGKFEACLVKIGCYDTWYPYDQQYETYNGGWST
jgi:hypothetical protein